MSDEPKDPQDSPIEPELEARVVAWVLGEASAFEASELARIVAEKPELAVFKRRIEAVHGLVGEATGPDWKPMQLAPERRQKLFATVGLTGAAAAPKVAALAVMPQAKAKKPRRIWRGSLLEVAAVLMIIGVLASLMFPTIGGVGNAPEAARHVSQVLPPAGFVEMQNAPADYRLVDVGGRPGSVVPGSAPDSASRASGSVPALVPALNKNANAGANLAVLDAEVPRGGVAGSAGRLGGGGGRRGGGGGGAGGRAGAGGGVAAVAQNQGNGVADTFGLGYAGGGGAGGDGLRVSGSGLGFSDQNSARERGGRQH